MLAKLNPTTTKSWLKLQRHYEEVKNLNMRALFAEDPQRFDKFSIRFNDLVVDFSKNRITAETFKDLIALARECDLKKAIDEMFSGAKINETENRAVLHIALRNRDNIPIVVDGRDVMPQVKAVLNQMENFSNRLISGDWHGYTGKKITDIVNIGIGGSDLGPLMVTEALQPYGEEGLRAHFVSNVDGTHPVPEHKHVLLIDTEFLDRLCVGRYGNKMPGDVLRITGCIQKPGPGGNCIGHGLVGGNRFGGEHEQNGLRIQIFEGLRKVGSIDV